MACLAEWWLFNYASLMLSDEQPSPEQISALRAISGERRLRLAEQLYWMARKMKAAGLRNQHPDWSDERINAEVTELFLHARS
jgi:hypothetical protein